MRPTTFKRLAFFLLADIFLSLLTLYMSYLLRFNFHIEAPFFSSFWNVFLAIILLKTLWMFWLKLYHAVWRFFSLFEAKRLLTAHAGAYLGFVLLFLVAPDLFSPFPRSVVVIDAVLSFVVLGGLRFTKRLIHEGRQEHSIRATLIIGAGAQASTIIQSALKGEVDYYPVAVFAWDDNKNSYLNNIKVYSMKSMEAVAKAKEATAAVIAEPLAQAELRQLTDRLNRMSIYDIKQVKLLGSEKERLEDLSIEDLLARNPQDLDTKQIEHFLQGKRVLITGAGGSIGSEIARQCVRFGVSSLTLVDHSEYNLYAIGEELPHARLALMSITDREAMETLFVDRQPDIVIHAAAYKHVPLCEANPHSAVENNVFGSRVVIDACIKHRVSKLVMISTDKAVRPTNVMGATKRIVELYAQNVESHQTEIVAVRFGNVLGSSGSVIPKFKQQIENGGPVTVTHPDMTRYFMLIPEACQLVLQAGAIARGGELFILDMGEPIKIVDLARQMIRLYGKEDEVDIVFSGTRPGEKLYEELLNSPEDAKTQYPSITVARPTSKNLTILLQEMDGLLEAENIRQALQSIVPEYQPQE